MHRLYDLLAGLPLLEPPWKSRVRKATKLRELSHLEDELRLAKPEHTVIAARARLLLLVMDEPTAPGGPTELDGERPHDVRVTLIDLERPSPLLRLRRHVAPGVFSDRGRAGHASSLDSCALSFDVREAVAKLAHRRMRRASGARVRDRACCSDHSSATSPACSTWPDRRRSAAYSYASLAP